MSFASDARLRQPTSPPGLRRGSRSSSRLPVRKTTHLMPNPRTAQTRRHSSFRLPRMPSAFSFRTMGALEPRCARPGARSIRSPGRGGARSRSARTPRAPRAAADRTTLRLPPPVARTAATRVRRRRLRFLPRTGEGEVRTAAARSSRCPARRNAADVQGAGREDPRRQKRVSTSWASIRVEISGMSPGARAGRKGDDDSGERLHQRGVEALRIHQAVGLFRGKRHQAHVAFFRPRGEERELLLLVLRERRQLRDEQHPARTPAGADPGSIVGACAPSNQGGVGLLQVTRVELGQSRPSRRASAPPCRRRDSSTAVLQLGEGVGAAEARDAERHGGARPRRAARASPSPAASAARIGFSRKIPSRRCASPPPPCRWCRGPTS